MEKVLKLDGVEVIFLPKEGVYEVWAMVSNGPDDFDWDVVLTTDDGEWAEANEEPEERERPGEWDVFLSIG